ncbi:MULTISPECIES: hypothetical protein [Rhizobium/Agrobacterium group]|uniref:Uncharacterized protein n=4 Tax=Rhizobium/Agrobacterium group TaxID=227290 RepID=A0A2Z2PGU5_RHIRH|nr:MULTISPECIES: hypothetical protein [Rhizobium/Agrobacterium group]AQS65513.1 hypothetical protein B0909_24395 [Rhizobium rhizogenes]ASK42063.1 hypothetical protein [Rhizobium rhizogenes]MCZ7445906.1 hypothetical protein [Rhizobium rhizogenes]MCZ7472668.1 hypothetical protein [Rhizobium rhizogenes]MCZ7484111.1 hypothetical protein [Rhizobium rhizogenes]
MNRQNIENRQAEAVNLVENYGPIGIRSVAAACAARPPQKELDESSSIEFPAVRARWLGDGDD